MTTTDTNVTLPPVPALPASPERKDIADLQHSLIRNGILRHWGSATRHDSEAAFFSDTLGLSGREEYVAFRDQLKAWINVLARGQKALSTRMAQPGGDSSAQMRKHEGARLVTRLVEMRRAGKTWSAAQAKKTRIAA